MTRFLIGLPESFETASLAIVEAESKEQALIEYRRGVQAKFPEFLEFVADKSVNMSFVERFWFSTSEEKSALDLSNSNNNDMFESIADETQFAKRIFDAFGENSELARDYVKYQLGKGESDVNSLPLGLAEFVAVNFSDDDWCLLFAVPLDSIPEIFLPKPNE